MTYPLIGNYGVNEEDIESRTPKVEGFVVKENSSIFSNWRGDISCRNISSITVSWAWKEWTPGTHQHIRVKGAMKAILSTEDLDRNHLIERQSRHPG